MRLRTLIVPVIAVALALSACGDDDDDGDGATGTTAEGGGGAERPAYREHRQGEPLERRGPGGSHLVPGGLRRPDQLARPTTRSRSRRTATSSRTSRSGPRPGRSIWRLPQPGADPDLVATGNDRAARGHGLRHRRLNDHVRRVVHGPRRVQREALRHPDEHQPQEHGLVPEGRLRRGRLQVPRRRRADRAVRPDRRRRRHPLVRRLRERGRDGLARHGLDGRHHAPDRGAGRLRQVGHP